MTEYAVRVYCPFDLSEFSVTVEGVDPLHARRQLVGRTVTCLLRADSFEVEEHNILSIYPMKRMPLPPYKTYLVDPTEKPPAWLLGADVVEEMPLPIGAKPIGAPRLAQTISNAIISLIYEQKVQSPEYPEVTHHIQYRRDIFTKFFEESRRMRKMGKIPEAVLYLIEHSPGITVRMIADILELGYWTTYREVAKLVPEKEVRRLTGEVEEQSTLNHWVPEEVVKAKEEIEAEAVKPKEPKVVFGSLWRKQLTIYPIKHKTEDELLDEVRRIFTLEAYMPTPDEWEQVKQAIKRQSDAQLKQRIEWWLGEKR